MNHHEKFNSCSKINIFFAYTDRLIEIFDIDKVFEAKNDKFIKIKGLKCIDLSLIIASLFFFTSD